MRKSLDEFQIDNAKTVWPEDEDITVIQALKDAIYIIAGLLFLLVIYGWQCERDLEDRLEAQQEVTQRYIGHLATAMNGGSLIDRNTDTAYFFDRPAVVELGGPK